MYQCHKFSYRILTICIILERSNTEFTRFLSPFLSAGSIYVAKLPGLLLKYDVGGIDWYPVVEIKHG